MPDYLGTLLLLLALELVLGVDNIVVITIIVSKLPEAQRKLARFIGLGLALVARLAMVAGFGFILQLEGDVIGGMSVHDLILLAGGGFLLWKAVREIHHTVEMIEHHGEERATPTGAFWSAIAMIVALDLVFALDSVITAVGLTDNMYVIWAAVILSFVVLMFSAGPIGEFVLKNPTFKILALSFLVTIGVVLVMEAFHIEVPKAYMYLPMGFATLIQLLQWRLAQNQIRKREALKAKNDVAANLAPGQ
jgi:predicted tellurium resistance membrane protein TerC